MSAKKSANAAVKTVRPLMSIDCKEAHTRMLGLYRGFYRYIPYIVKHHDIAKNEQQIHKKLREAFYQNACVTDLRVIDMLIIKGFIELKEVRNQWQQKHHIIRHWNPSHEPQPRDFLGRFLAGMDP